jgi:hypothetical protein
MKRQILSLSCVALFLMCFVAPFNSRVAADRANHQTAPVNTTPDGFVLGPEVPGASATLVRSRNGITANVHTTVSSAGVYSLWWVIFNHPETQCTDPSDNYQCEYDLPDIVVNATGHISAGGNLNMSAWLGVGGPYSGEVICPGFAGPCSGVGLTNPEGAVVLLVIRYHGPATPGIIPQQLTTYLGGPDDCAVCVDEQLVLFAP